MYIRDVSDLSVDTKKEEGRLKINQWPMDGRLRNLTFDDVSNIMVDRSNTSRAAVIWARLRSSLRSLCLSPVIS